MYPEILELLNIKFNKILIFYSCLALFYRIIEMTAPIEVYAVNIEESSSSSWQSSDGEELPLPRLVRKRKMILHNKKLRMYTNDKNLGGGAGSEKSKKKT